MTNREWINTLSNEDFIYEITKRITITTTTTPACLRGNPDITRTTVDVTYLENWLKEEKELDGKLNSSISNDEKYYWSYCEDDEIWNNHENSIDNCLTQANEDKDDEEFVYVGEVMKWIPKVDVIDLLEDLEQQAYDGYQELGENWKSHDCSKKEELRELSITVNDAVRCWLKKYGYYPDFGAIVNVKEYKLEDKE